MAGGHRLETGIRWCGDIMMLRRSRGVFMTSSTALSLSSGWLLGYLGPAMLCDVDRVLEGPCEPWEAEWCLDSDSMKSRSTLPSHDVQEAPQQSGQHLPRQAPVGTPCAKSTRAGGTADALLSSGFAVSASSAAYFRQRACPCPARRRHSLNSGGPVSHRGCRVMPQTWPQRWLQRPPDWRRAARPAACTRCLWTIKMSVHN